MISFANLLPRYFRPMFALLAATVLLTGCGDNDRPRGDDDDKDHDKKSAELRVAILHSRFESMEASLTDLEQQTQIQKQAIERTRSEMKAIRKSLTKGNLKGYSLENVSSDPLILKTIQDKRSKENKEERKEEKREEAQKGVLSTVVMALFALFLAVIFTMFWRERRNGPAPYNPSDYEPYGSDEPEGTDTPSESTDPANTADQHDQERPNDLPPSGL